MAARPRQRRLPTGSGKFGKFPAGRRGGLDGPIGKQDGKSPPPEPQKAACALKNEVQAAFCLSIYSELNSTGQGDNARRLQVVHKGIGNAVLV